MSTTPLQTRVRSADDGVAVIELTRLDEVISVHADEQHAVAAARTGAAVR